MYNMATTLIITRSIIFALSCLIMLCLATSSSDDHTHTSTVVPRVSVNLYYETLCPGCQQFISEDLNSLFHNGLIDIVQLRLVPWGNALVQHSNNSFLCQHGPDECFLNTVAACAINTWPSPSDYFPFILCVENLALKGKHTEWETCFAKLKLKPGLDPERVEECSSNQDGKQLELGYASETEALKPPLEFVPWVVVDEKPLREEMGMLIAYICKAYKGSLPKACESHKTQQVEVYPSC